MIYTRESSCKLKSQIITINYAEENFAANNFYRIQPGILEANAHLPLELYLNPLKLYSMSQDCGACASQLEGHAEMKLKDRAESDRGRWSNSYLKDCIAVLLCW